MPPVISRVSAQTHPTRRKGFAEVEVIGQDLPASGIVVQVARTDSGFKEYLAGTGGGEDPETVVHGWRTDVGAVVPITVSGGGDHLRITLGKNVLAHMDQQSVYRFTFLVGDSPLGPERGVRWRDVAPVESTERSVILQAAPPEGAASASPAPGSGLAAGQTPGHAPPSPPAPPQSPSSPLPSLDRPLPPLPVSGEDRASGRGILRAALLPLLMAALGGALWYFVFHAPPSPEGQPPGAEGAVEGAAAPPNDVALAPPDGPKRGQGKPSLEEVARRSPDEMVAEAIMRRERSEIDEALFLLRTAGDQGSAEALRQMGQIYDPTNLTPGRTTQTPAPNIERAYTFYQKAVGLGSAAARDDLARLHLTVERQAASGDATAQALLTRWAP